MRKIRFLEISIFLSLQGLVWLMIGLIVYQTLKIEIPQALLAIVILAALVLLYFLLNALVYRIFFALVPLQPRNIPPA